MGMTFSWRPKTPVSILMRWSVSVYVVDCQRIHTTINQSSASASTPSVRKVRKWSGRFHAL